MNTFENLLNNVLTAGFVVIAVFVVVIVYLLKKKRIFSKEERVNHDSFERKDSKDYIQFDNIISWDGGVGSEKFGIIVMPNHTFIAGLDIKGYNFASASADERKRTMVNSIAFFNTVEQPVQFRQSSKAVDISYNIEKQEKVLKDLQYRRLVLSENYKENTALLDDYMQSPELYNALTKKLDELQTEISSVIWQIKETAQVLEYMKEVAASTGKSRKINQLMFAYTFDPADYSTELTEEEIYVKAANELATKGAIYGDALNNCGCSTRMMTAQELLDLLRRHLHPNTSDDLSLRDLFNSSYQALFIHSDSVIKLEQEIRHNKRLEKQMREYNLKRAQQIEQARAELMKYSSALETASVNYVDQIDGAEELPDEVVGDTVVMEGGTAS